MGFFGFGKRSGGERGPSSSPEAPSDAGKKEEKTEQDSGVRRAPLPEFDRTKRNGLDEVAIAEVHRLIQERDAAPREKIVSGDRIALDIVREQIRELEEKLDGKEDVRLIAQLRKLHKERDLISARIEEQERK